jgi:hypothetical protein
MLLMYTFYGFHDLIFDSSSNYFPVLTLTGWFILSLLVFFIWYIISCLILFGFEKMFVKIKRGKKDIIKQ